jgi:ribosomal protein S18 acetylase RimI-like enzyme
MRGQATVEEVGLRGVLPGAEDSRIRLLVTDDQAYDRVAALLPDARAGMIRVFGTAARCAQLVAEQLAWSCDTATAMVCSDLHTVPALTLPSDLTLRPVRRLAEDEGGGVALADAVLAAMYAAPSIEGPPRVFADFLRSLPPTFRLFAAVDSDGKVRATSGYGAFDQYATVIFVNTDPGWRRRGIGLAMTAQALGAAQRAGARQASLDASDAGRSIYRRLGFETAGTLTRFTRLS